MNETEEQQSTLEKIKVEVKEEIKTEPVENDDSIQMSVISNSTDFTENSSESMEMSEKEIKTETLTSPIQSSAISGKKSRKSLGEKSQKSLSVFDLRKKLNDLGLDHTGKKQTLIDRLKEYEISHNAKIETPPASKVEETIKEEIKIEPVENDINQASVNSQEFDRNITDDLLNRHVVDNQEKPVVVKKEFENFDDPKGKISNGYINSSL